MRKRDLSLSFFNEVIMNAESHSLDKKFQDSENSFKSIFERSPFGNIILSKDLVILQANPAFSTLLGYESLNMITGSFISQYAHKDFKTDWLLLQQHLWVQQSPSFTLETCLVRRDGTEIWCKLTSILYQETGSTLGYTIIEDVSKRKVYEDALKQSEANLRTILDNADAGYVLYDSELRIVTFNHRAQQFSSMLYEKELAEGNYMLDYFPQERHQLLLGVTNRVLRGEDVRYEMGFDQGTTNEKWMDVMWINVNSENKNWGFILASKNITEGKMASLEREKITLELIQRNKALEQFTNITSHNLRAPVANIIGLVELISEMEMDETEKKEMMDGILLSAKNLDMVITDINDILHIKELVKGGKEKVNLEHLVHDITFSISSMVTKANACIKCDFERAPEMTGIRSYVYSIFYNMILNSIKYRKPDIKAEITLTSKVTKNKLILSFKDNGKGIDMERNGEKLFGLYKRFDTSVDGRGLGLFMVKTQIETLGGTIEVRSELGVGTEFIVRFPV